MNKKQLHKHQLRMGVKIKHLNAKPLKQLQAHILCQSLIDMLRIK